MALLTAAATFPLIFIGGLVTSHGAGLAVPDWPNSYGYNMFLFPPGQWVGNIWYEHVHRLYASGVGLLCVVLCVWAWLADRRTTTPAVRWLATGLLALVIFQGVLGGLRVVLLKLDLAIVHGCTAQAFFCLAALTALVSGRWWSAAPDLSAAKEGDRGRRLMRLAVLAVAVVFGQLVVGAVMRHYRAGLAIPDLPLSYGHVLPPTSDDQLDRRIWERMSVTEQGYLGLFTGVATDTAAPRWAGASKVTIDGRTEALTLGKVWLHFGHRLGAIVVSAVLLMLIVKVLRLHRGRPDLLLPALLLVALLLTQLTLGALTVLLRKPADVASAHVAVGALVLVTTFVLAARSVRLYRPRPVAVRGAFEVVRPAVSSSVAVRSPALHALGATRANA